MKNKKTTGVAFDPSVLEFLDQIAVKEELSRSKVINRIIKEYARNRERSITKRLFEKRVTDSYT